MVGLTAQEFLQNQDGAANRPPRLFLRGNALRFAAISLWGRVPLVLLLGKL